MALRLDAGSADFEARFRALLGLKRETAADVDGQVADIIADVRRRGDRALLDYTRRFDRLDLEPASLRISSAEIDDAARAADAATLSALALAAERIERYHLRQKPEDARWTDESGVELGWRWTPVESAGLYVPGGTAAYPSSVLMNAIPARVAGVERLVCFAVQPASASPGTAAKTNASRHSLRIEAE